MLALRKNNEQEPISEPELNEKRKIANEKWQATENPLYNIFDLHFYVKDEMTPIGCAYHKLDEYRDCETNEIISDNRLIGKCASYQRPLGSRAVFYLNPCSVVYHDQNLYFILSQYDKLYRNHRGRSIDGTKISLCSLKNCEGKSSGIRFRPAHLHAPHYIPKFNFTLPEHYQSLASIPDYIKKNHNTYSCYSVYGRYNYFRYYEIDEHVPSCYIITKDEMAKGKGAKCCYEFDKPQKLSHDTQLPIYISKEDLSSNLEAINESIIYECREINQKEYDEAKKMADETAQAHQAEIEAEEMAERQAEEVRCFQERIV